MNKHSSIRPGAVLHLSRNLRYSDLSRPLAVEENSITFT